MTRTHTINPGWYTVDDPRLATLPHRHASVTTHPNGRIHINHPIALTNA